MLAVALYFIAIIAVVRATTSTCNNSSIPKGATGFGVRIYSYENNSNAGWGSDFFTSGYKTTLLKSLSGVNDINFMNSDGTLYGYDISSQNYTLELDAIIKAPETGKYTFTIGANDGASIQIGLNQICCDDFSGSGFGDFRKDVLGPIESFSEGLTTATVSVDLIKDLWYPIKVIMFNAYGPDGLNIYATSPTLSTSNIAQYVTQTILGQKCVRAADPIFSSITTPWAESYSRTSSLDSMSSFSASVSLYPSTGAEGTTLVTTNSDGSVATKSGVVDVTTNSAGSLYTTTSLLPSSSVSSSASSSASSSVSSSGLQEYTTTFVTTNSDGSVATKSGVVDVTTNSAGSLYTTTSLLPSSGVSSSASSSASSSVSSSGLQEYTTTFVTTNSDGSVATKSGVVENSSRVGRFFYA
ncbi:hypothetical protein OXX59_001515, partial [Metschnikowia pulcherrima]